MSYYRCLLPLVSGVVLFRCSLYLISTVVPVAVSVLLEVVFLCKELGTATGVSVPLLVILGLLVARSRWLWLSSAADISAPPLVSRSRFC